jgi:hypothetical protein
MYLLDHAALQQVLFIASNTLDSTCLERCLDALVAIVHADQMRQVREEQEEEQQQQQQQQQQCDTILQHRKDQPTILQNPANPPPAAVITSLIKGGLLQVISQVL